MKLILFLIDEFNAQDNVSPSLPSKDPKLVIDDICKVLNLKSNSQYNYAKRQDC